MDDLDLLREYAERKSEPAFATLVKRHANLVYSAARRQVRDQNLVEEVAQAVFLILAEKAASIRPPIVLSGWLFRTTRFVAANALRREQTRHHYEREAMAVPFESSPSESAWERIAPLLDEALIGLRDKDRDALVLRFMEKKSFREVGDALGTTEDNAQKRVTRALEKLRSFFGRRGHLIPAVTLAGILTANSVQAASGGLVASIMAAASAKKGGAVISGATLCQTTLQMLARARFKMLALRSAGVLLLAATALLVVQNRPSAPPAAQAQIQARSGEQPSPAAPGSPAPVAVSTTLQPERRFAFRVLDATNDAPQSGVKLTLREVADYPNRTTSEFLTDRNGFGLLPSPGMEQKNWGYQIEVFQDGYVPKYVSWSAGQGDIFGDFPMEYTTKLERGVTVGGVVVNEGSDPIEGVRVVFSVSGSAPGSSRDRERLTMMGNYHEERSDAQGRWTCNHVPEQFGMITWRLVHREYQDVTYRTSAPEAGTSVGLPRLPKADYLAGRALMSMKRGLVITGIVVDEAGQPVFNAKVTQDRDFRKPEASLLTDGEGRFRFQNVREKATTLTIQSDGFAPQDRKLKPVADLEEQRFILLKGGLLRGRVLDESSQPVGKATVRVASDSFGYEMFEWRAKTDAEGRFEWLTAPLTAQKYSASAGDYDSSSGLELPTDGVEHVITLTRNTRKRLRLTTWAFDAETKQPIRKFKVAVAEAQDPVTNAASIIGLGFSTPQPKGEGKTGVGVVTLSSYTTRFAAEIQAEGYLPTRVTNVNSGQGELTLTFELRKGEPVRGVVRSPDGQPVKGALVLLLAEHDQAQMLLPGQFQADRIPIAGRTQTDAQGRFSFGPKLEMRNVIASHTLGFGKISVDDLKPSEEIILEPWGRVEGVFKVGTQPNANQMVRLEEFHWRFGGWPALMITLRTKTDADGRFVFEGVPPGERKVCFSPTLSNGRSGASAFSHEQPVIVKPGETTQVTLGGTGRTVAGRVSAPGISKPIDWQQDVHNLKLKVGIPSEAVVPEREDFPTDEAYMSALKACADRSRPFWLSEAGREAQRMQRTYMLLFNPDGSFRVDDVPPGSYELSVTPMEPPAPIKTVGGGSVFPSFGTKPIGSLKMEIVVPEADGEQARAALDLGLLYLKPTAPLPAE
jgi:RNA polymerase sigma factor (sigma-70 family)